MDSSAVCGLDLAGNLESLADEQWGMLLPIGGVGINILENMSGKIR